MLIRGQRFLHDQHEAGDPVQAAGMSTEVVLADYLHAERGAPCPDAQPRRPPPGRVRCCPEAGQDA